VDLLVVIGTSLKVAPVSEVLGKLPSSSSYQRGTADGQLISPTPFLRYIST
jgi:NAD-dependent SIR2 family protein deacetylase